MSESSMWGRVRRALVGLDPVRIENSVECGTPDVNYVEGWIELKWVRAVPKRGGVLTIEHYTEDQKTWAIRRHHAGGKVFLLLCAQREWLLFYGHTAAQFLNKVSLEELRKVAIKTWPKKLNDQELRQLLTQS